MVGADQAESGERREDDKEEEGFRVEALIELDDADGLIEDRAQVLLLLKWVIENRKMLEKRSFGGDVGRTYGISVVQVHIQSVLTWRVKVGDEELVGKGHLLLRSDQAVVGNGGELVWETNRKKN